MGKNRNKHPRKLTNPVIKDLLQEPDSHASVNSAMQIPNTLKFLIHDLRYIFVSTDGQLVKMIGYLEKLDSLCGKTIDNKQRSLLMSKLTSLETIRRDY